jgi:hypothetical protein
MACIDFTMLARAGGAGRRPVIGVGARAYGNYLATNLRDRSLIALDALTSVWAADGKVGTAEDAGNLVFSDFEYTATPNGPTAASINVNTTTINGDFGLEYRPGSEREPRSGPGILAAAPSAQRQTNGIVPTRGGEDNTGRGCGSLARFFLVRCRALAARAHRRMRESVAPLRDVVRTEVIPCLRCGLASMRRR